MEWLIVLIAIAGAAGVAFQLGKRQSPSQRKIEELENLVVEKDRELQNYQAKVNHHFEKSADLFSRVTNNYQELYQYMAKSSEMLGGAPVFKNALENQSTAHFSQIPNNPEAPFNGEDTFSNESLYRAHEYRNEPEEIEPEETVAEEEASADIIHLDKQKETKGEPPLDYAVKEKGVINHNSLNMDNVKT
ncbi:MAG: DUF1043 family protein [Gammaproteobacteria bacterium]|nr:DUF1043 family protein [Gammaproteobacteria bacterium]NVK87125.1 DUF1043 family protein [Gammaproteobacteria bacterium]